MATFKKETGGRHQRQKKLEKVGKRKQGIFESKKQIMKNKIWIRIKPENVKNKKIVEKTYFK